MMKLSSLLRDLVSAGDIPADPEIGGVHSDSRRIGHGDLFIAMQGTRVDGHRFAAQAAEQGAVAILCEDASRLPADLGLPVVALPDLAGSLHQVASRFFGDPSASLSLIGITGTNGKTSTSYFVKGALEALGLRCGLIGTIHYLMGEHSFKSINTTPDALELQRLLAGMRDAGMQAVVMEVSSHGLALGRVSGLHFDCAVLTNVTEDHLDFHGSMEAYLEAKLSFLDLLRSAGKGERRVCYYHAIQYQERVLEAIVASGLPAWSFGDTPEADFAALEPVADISRTSFRVRAPQGTEELSLAARGYFSILNALAACAASAVLGAGPTEWAAGMAAVQVPGRFEIVDRGQDFLVVVDYAHTDDALRNLLQAARRLQPQRVITVFGCGGDRDRGKRPLMGAVAAEHSDLVVVTSDNPRSETPGDIIQGILPGVKRHLADPMVIEDRAQAIAWALREACSGDIVLIAGKGHEDYQVFADRTIHFSDQETAAAILEQLCTQPD